MITIDAVKKMNIRLSDHNTSPDVSDGPFLIRIMVAVISAQGHRSVQLIITRPSQK